MLDYVPTDAVSFFLLAATDGHAKNYSLFLNRRDTYGMTPLCDILSRWPYFGKRNDQFDIHKAGLAMAVRSTSVHHRFHEIQTRHWPQLAMKNGGPDMWVVMLELVARTDQALTNDETRLPIDFPPRIGESISLGMKEHARRFTAGLNGI